MAPSMSRRLGAAVAAGSFTSIEASILGGALDSAEPWSGYALLQRVPECSKASFYRSLKRLRARRIILEAPNTGGKWTINATIENWKNRAGDAPLFSKGTPAMLGFRSRMEGASAATETATKARKTRRVEPAVDESLPRPGTDTNGDLPGQRHLADRDGADFNKKESSIWEKAKKAMREAHGGT